MIKNTNVAEFSDLLHHAKDIGYDWNDAHDKLNKADVSPEDRYSRKFYYKEQFEDGVDQEDYENVIDIKHTDAIKIIKSFFIKEEIEHFMLIY